MLYHHAELPILFCKVVKHVVEVSNGFTEICRSETGCPKVKSKWRPTECKYLLLRCDQLQLESVFNNCVWHSPVCGGYFPVSLQDYAIMPGGRLPEHGVIWGLGHGAVTVLWYGVIWGLGRGQ